MRKRSGKRNNRYIQLTALALCAVLAGGGCSAPAGGDGAKGQSQPGSSQQTVSGTNDGQGVKKEPAYVYYIKDANLMRADEREYGTGEESGCAGRESKHMGQP